MSKANPINVDRVRELLEYTPEKGGSCLSWKTQKGKAGRAKSGAMAGRLNDKGYWVVGIGNGTGNGRQPMAHRLVWAIVYGEDAPCDIDHINGVRSDNRIENLRLCPNGDLDNAQNRGIPRNNNSGFIGVTWNKARKKYQAQIHVGQSCKYLGLFDTPEQAYEAYLKAKAEIHEFQPVPRSSTTHIQRVTI